MRRVLRLFVPLLSTFGLIAIIQKFRQFIITQDSEKPEPEPIIRPDIKREVLPAPPTSLPAMRQLGSALLILECALVAAVIFFMGLTWIIPATVGLTTLVAFGTGWLSNRVATTQNKKDLLTMPWFHGLILLGLCCIFVLGIKERNEDRSREETQKALEASMATIEKALRDEQNPDLEKSLRQISEQIDALGAQPSDLTDFFTGFFNNLFGNTLSDTELNDLPNNGLIPANTATSSATATSFVASATATPEPAATTAVPISSQAPTNTATSIPTKIPSPTPNPPQPTATQTSSPTSTATRSTLNPTATPSATDNPPPSATATPTSTSLPTPTPSLIPTSTSTPTPSATATPTPTFTPSPTLSPTPIATPSTTSTSTATLTLTPSATPSPTPTLTPSPTATSSPTPTKAPDDCVGADLNFELTASGETLFAGHIVSDEWAACGIQISTHDPINFPPMIFDSSAPPSYDLDLGTPNESFGGTGVGRGGEAGQPGQNKFAQNNILTISDGIPHNPNDNGDGGTFIFTFEDGRCISFVRLIDIDGDNDGEPITVFGENGAMLNQVTMTGLGDNSIQTVQVDTSSVYRLEIKLVDSGALVAVGFCS